LTPGDQIDFGIDIMSSDGLTVMYRKVSCRVSFEFGGIVSSGDVVPPLVGTSKKSVVSKKKSTSSLSPDDLTRLDVCALLLTCCVEGN
jgi:hypothetical protein